MGILPAPTTPATTTTAAAPTPACPLDAQQRQHLALAALTGQAITDLADQYQVSRKFVYQQRDLARQVLAAAFTPPTPPDEPVLFVLPVTHSWLRQFMLASLLVGHSSLRGVQEILADVFAYDVSLGTIHNVVAAAVPSARAHNAAQDLSRIHVAAHDEIFQNGQPVLVGADVRSSYCYLLRQAEHRDADTWAIHLLDLQRQRFAPWATIADGGKGLRAGQAIALPGVPCWADSFHAERELSQLVCYLENRAYSALTALAKLERHAARSPAGPAAAALQQRLAAARPVAARAVDLADDVAQLATWLRADILAVAGPLWADRVALFQFVVAELRQREPQCPHRIGPVRRLLENQQDELLAFAADVDRDVASLAAYCQLSPQVIRALLAMQCLPADAAARWQAYSRLRHQLGERFAAVNDLVAQLRAEVVRASSVVENLNSRLRNYFFLRRQLGPEYLELLQFFLNHRRFVRSERAERVGHSPREVLTGQEHGHWLELLGYQRYQRAG